jgi:hypothetical protein
MAIGLETLRDCKEDLRVSKVYHPDPTGPQVHWPGMQIAEKSTKF